MSATADGPGRAGPCFQQHPSAVLDYTADFLGHAGRWREALKSYALNTAVNPDRANGLQFVCTKAGRTGVTEPRWPRNVGDTVTDGGVIWTAQDFSAASLKRILTGAVWTASSGVTLGTKADSTFESTNTISGGKDGQRYEIAVTGTFSDGTADVVTFSVEVTIRPRNIRA